jgi:hypothetical protein
MADRRDKLVKQFVAKRGYDRTPGSKAKGGYQITPDQFDRNRERSTRRRRFRPRDPVTAQRNQVT